MISLISNKINQHQFTPPRKRGQNHYRQDQNSRWEQRVDVFQIELVI